MGDYFNDVNTVKNVSKVMSVNMGLSDRFRSPPRKLTGMRNSLIENPNPTPLVAW